MEERGPRRPLVEVSCNPVRRPNNLGPDSPHHPEPARTARPHQDLSAFSQLPSPLPLGKGLERLLSCAVRTPMDEAEQRTWTQAIAPGEQSSAPRATLRFTLGAGVTPAARRGGD